LACLGAVPVRVGRAQLHGGEADEADGLHVHLQHFQGRGEPCLERKNPPTGGRKNAHYFSVFSYLPMFSLNDSF